MLREKIINEDSGEKRKRGKEKGENYIKNGVNCLKISSFLVIKNESKRCGREEIIEMHNMYSS